MENKKSIAKNSIYYLIYNVLNILFPFITGIYVARVLLPDSVGQVAYAQNIVQYFVILSYLGIPTYGLREVAKVKDDQFGRSKLFSELFIINAVSTTFFLTIYLILIFAVPTFQSQLPLYLIVGLLIAFNLLNISWLYEGMEEFRFISIRNIIFKAVSFICLLLFVRGQDDVLWYAAITVIGTAGNYIVNMLCHGRFAHFTLKGLEFKKHIKPIIFLVAVNLAIEIYSLVDTTMIGIFCKDENVAFYSYGSKIYKILLQVVNSFTMVIVPRISEYYAKGEKDKFDELLSSTVKTLLLLAIPMTIGIQFVAGYVVDILYTSAYESSAMVLRILCWILIISPIGYLLGSRVCLVTGHENQMLISVAIGAVVNVIGNSILIQVCQEDGAAIASVFSEFVVMFIYVLQGKRYFKLRNVKKDALKIVGAAFVMTAGLVLMDLLLPVGETWKLIIEVFVSIIVYFATLMVVKEEKVCKIWNKCISRLKRNA